MTQAIKYKGLSRQTLCQMTLIEPLTISVATENDYLVLDVTGNGGHRVPNRGHLGVDYEREKGLCY